MDALLDAAESGVPGDGEEDEKEEEHVEQLLAKGGEWATGSCNG